MKRLCGIVLALLLAGPAWAQDSLLSFGKAGRKTQARLVLSHESARPGDSIMAGLELTMAPGWHTYWRNSGESGDATKVNWTLPAGITAGEIQWPVPVKHEEGGLYTYVYYGKAVLLVPLKIAADAAPGTHDLSALVKWLECEKVCVPGSATVKANLLIGRESKPGPESALFTEAESRLPVKNLPGSVTGQWQTPNGDERAFVLEWMTDATEPDFFPYANSLVLFGGKTELLASSGGKVVLRKLAEKLNNDWPREIAGLLIRKEGERNMGYEVSVPLEATPAPPPPPNSVEVSVLSPASPAVPERSLWEYLVLAFVGGLILNIMPCVLPVIALKILGFVSQGREHPRRVRMLGLLYTLGVIASFLVLAGIVVAVKAAGQRAGWGMQFGNPQFIVILAIIVTLVALNLFGVFEVTLAGKAMGAASEAASRHGASGAFMNGVLATVLATPCTAPFLGVSLGFAFVQPAPIIVLFFVVIALGLALPYLVLSWNPRLLKFLPKPGVWMERFKVAMGFPMAATAVWLLSLTLPHYGNRFWWLGIFLVVLALAAWVFGTFVQRPGRRRGSALVLTLLLLGGGFGYTVESKLRWRSPIVETATSERISNSPEGYAWRRWSPENLAEARRQGVPVLVDFTAAWCITCQTVVKPALESETVLTKLKEVNAIALLGDYTKYPPEITAELEKFGRAGVPLVVVYPKDANQTPIVLPDVILSATMAKNILKALDEAAR